MVDVDCCRPPCCSHPFMYFPSFYLLKGSMQQRSPAESLRLCYDETWENCKALWAVWVPAQLVNFSVVPMHLRIPFGNLGALGHWGMAGALGHGGGTGAWREHWVQSSSWFTQPGKVGALKQRGSTTAKREH